MLLQKCLFFFTSSCDSSDSTDKSIDFLFPVDEKDEMSIKDAAEAVIEAMDFKGQVIVCSFLFLFFKVLLFCRYSDMVIFF